MMSGLGAAAARCAYGSLLLGGLACAGMPAQEASLSGPAADSCPATVGQVTLNLVNSERRRHGLPRLVPDLKLIAAARAHVADLARTGKTAHADSDGSTPSERVTATGYAWTAVGENIAAGQRSPDQVVAEWMKSEPHRRNLLNRQYTSAGVAMIDAPTSRWGTYWVMVYASGPRGPASSVARCHP